MRNERDLHTPLCDLLGRPYPVLQAGMGGVAPIVSPRAGTGRVSSSGAPKRDCLLRQSEKESANAGHEHGADRPFGKSLTRH